MIKNLKQDRQGIRRAKEIEQKYDLSKLRELSEIADNQIKEMTKYNQEMTVLYEKMKALENKIIFPVNSIHVSMIAENPSVAFGGEWELVTEGYLLFGVDPNSEIPEAFYGNEKCYVWKRIS